ncbi:MAG: YegS/Rv2252/BmrU family lipid kinase [Bacteroidales bacterium]|nr:YegS/Rv2252/BmrU family lipid kinase [Bacteroidales bacterium]
MATNNLNVTQFTWQVILNPNAREHNCLKIWKDIEKLLREKNIQYVIHFADAPLKGIETARQLCMDGHRHLMVLGGDGTLNEVVNGICESGVALNEVYLAVMPVGRGNDWARTHNFSTEIGQNLEIFLKGNFMQHDIGVVKTLEHDVEKAHRYFINIAGFGFDAEVIHDVTHNKPHFLGISVYVLSLIRCLFRYKSQQVDINGSDFHFKDKSFLMVAGICQYNGGGMRQVPMAVPDDRKLDVVVVPNVRGITVVANVGRIFKGTHIQSIKGILTYQTDRLKVNSDTLLRSEVEGELLSTGDYRVELVPQTLNVLTNL